ncbi:Uncharacterized protein GBIM_13279 [Gryllus bimaculatus]|nr:Uncharacterized protein GBIM_13279 [Gryllus bimaculatus]
MEAPARATPANGGGGAVSGPGACRAAAAAAAAAASSRIDQYASGGPWERTGDGGGCGMFWRARDSKRWLRDNLVEARVAKDLEDKRSHYEPSLGPAPDDADHPFKLEEHDFVPHFQRVSISGEDTSGNGISPVVDKLQIISAPRLQPSVVGLQPPPPRRRTLLVEADRGERRLGGTLRRRRTRKRDRLRFNHRMCTKWTVEFECVECNNLQSM